MTITTTPAPDTQHHTDGVLSPPEALDACVALMHAADPTCTSLDARDRQALALLTYDRKACRSMPAMLIERILDGTYPLPVDDRRARLLLRLIDRLPAITGDDIAAWTSARNPVTTIEAEPAQPEPLLTPFDILDAYCALQNAAAADCYQISAADRQALALLTYWDGLDPEYRANLAWLLEGPSMLPVSPHNAQYLLRIADSLPPVSLEDQDAWLAARDTETPCVIDRIITALAGQAAASLGTPDGHAFFAAMQTVIRIGRPEIPLDLVPGTARHEIETAVADLDPEEIPPGPPDAPVEDPAIAAWAEYTAAFGSDSNGHLRSAFKAAILARLGTPATEAVDLARSPSFDEQVRAAGREADRLIDEAQRAQMASEYGEQPAAVAL